MKKSVLAVTAILVLTVSGIALAQMDKGKDTMGDKGMGMMGSGMMKGDMMGKGMMDGKMKGMCPMMHSMMQKQVVATSDGGIVVVGGNKITKYDKDLNVVKEVEQKMDMEDIQKMMGQMKGMCPMMEKMQSSKESMGEESNESAAEEKAEHESHHPENK